MNPPGRRSAGSFAFFPEEGIRYMGSHDVLSATERTDALVQQVFEQRMRGCSSLDELAQVRAEMDCSGLSISEFGKAANLLLGMYEVMSR